MGLCDWKKDSVFYNGKHSNFSISRWLKHCIPFNPSGSCQKGPSFEWTAKAGNLFGAAAKEKLAVNIEME
jgi:hypothetical protein